MSALPPPPRNEWRAAIHEDPDISPTARTVALAVDDAAGNLDELAKRLHAQSIGGDDAAVALGELERAGHIRRDESGAVIRAVLPGHPTASSLGIAIRAALPGTDTVESTPPTSAEVLAAWRAAKQTHQWLDETALRVYAACVREGHLMQPKRLARDCLIGKERAEVALRQLHNAGLISTHSTKPIWRLPDVFRTAA